MSPSDSPAHATAPGSTYVVNVYDSLQALPPHYETLFVKAGRSSFFFTLPWFSNYVRNVLAPDERVRVYAVEAGHAPTAARAVLALQHRVSPGSRESRVLQSLANYYTSQFGVVCDPNQPDLPQVFDALAKAIATDTPRWSEIDLHPLSIEEPYFTQLIASLKKAGLLTQPYFCFGNWYLEVNGQTFQAYFKQRPSRLVNTHKRKRKALEAGGHFRFDLYKTADKLEQALADYNTIYNSSWKVPEPYPNFIAGLIRTCAEQGWLRLGIGYVDNEPAAAQIWIVSDGQALIYKLAYDERFAKLSVGTVISSMLMEYAIDVDKVKIVDYLTGDDSYKRDWMSHRRERWGIRAFNPRTPQGLLAAARHVGGRAARRAVDALRQWCGGKKT